ncbi:MAG TPA: HAMP domain-containing sensor histidine kinase, partial [Planctomycetota bacterium]|nr:HAMP domain-containing sensor histidine kinase [Planctomycetota bacterium]
ERRLAELFAERVAATLDHLRLAAEVRSAGRAKEDFLLIASHEMRSPVAALQVELHGLGVALGEGNMDRARERGRAVRDLGDRLEDLVNNLLDDARLSGGRFELRREVLDLRDVAEMAARRFEETARRRGIALRVGGGRLLGRWDRMVVEQAIANLLSNALRFGAGQPVDVDVSFRDDRAAARVTVRDRGPGIAPDDLPRLFHRFSRLDNGVGGLGLGLFVVRSLVEAHGGRVYVESTPGQGTAFAFELPLAPVADESRET